MATRVGGGVPAGGRWTSKNLFDVVFDTIPEDVFLDFGPTTLMEKRALASMQASVEDSSAVQEEDGDRLDSGHSGGLPPSYPSLAPAVTVVPSSSRIRRLGATRVGGGPTRLPTGFRLEVDAIPEETVAEGSKEEKEVITTKEEEEEDVDVASPLPQKSGDIEKGKEEEEAEERRDGDADPKTDLLDASGDRLFMETHSHEEESAAPPPPPHGEVAAPRPLESSKDGRTRAPLTAEEQLQRMPPEKAQWYDGVCVTVQPLKGFGFLSPSIGGPDIYFTFESVCLTFTRLVLFCHAVQHHTFPLPPQLMQWVTPPSPLPCVEDEADDDEDENKTKRMTSEPGQEEEEEEEKKEKKESGPSVEVYQAIAPYLPAWEESTASGNATVSLGKATFCPLPPTTWAEIERAWTVAARLPASRVGLLRWHIAIGTPNVACTNVLSFRVQYNRLMGSRVKRLLRAEPIRGPASCAFATPEEQGWFCEVFPEAIGYKHTSGPPSSPMDALPSLTETAKDETEATADGLGDTVRGGGEGPLRPKEEAEEEKTRTSTTTTTTTTDEEEQKENQREEDTATSSVVESEAPPSSATASERKPAVAPHPSLPPLAPPSRMLERYVGFIRNYNADLQKGYIACEEQESPPPATASAEEAEGRGGGGHRRLLGPSSSSSRGGVPDVLFSASAVLLLPGTSRRVLSERIMVRYSVCGRGPQEKYIATLVTGLDDAPLSDTNMVYAKPKESSGGRHGSASEGEAGGSGGGGGGRRRGGPADRRHRRWNIAEEGRRSVEDGGQEGGEEAASRPTSVAAVLQALYVGGEEEDGPEEEEEETEVRRRHRAGAPPASSASLVPPFRVQGETWRKRERTDVGEEEEAGPNGIRRRTTWNGQERDGLTGGTGFPTPHPHSPPPPPTSSSVLGRGGGGVGYPDRGPLSSLEEEVKDRPRGTRGVRPSWGSPMGMRQRVGPQGGHGGGGGASAPLGSSHGMPMASTPSRSGVSVASHSHPIPSSMVHSTPHPHGDATRGKPLGGGAREEEDEDGLLLFMDELEYDHM